MTFKDHASLKKINNQLGKRNKQMEKAKIVTHPTPSMIKREEAKVDNARPGSGLRKGGGRQQSSPSSRREGGQRNAENESSGDEETGWGGCPLKPVVEVEENAQDASSDLPAETVNGDIQEEEIQEPIAAQCHVKPPVESTKPTDPPTESFTTNYYFHAQQAFIVASLGGLTGALEAGPEDVGPPKQTGRSLFLALDIETWEPDADVILEVGWAAVWWQEKLGIRAEEEGGFEQFQDRGHYM